MPVKMSIKAKRGALSAYGPKAGALMQMTEATLAGHFKE